MFDKIFILDLGAGYPFSAALFEPGYAGALETWRRLLELCEWDFNERYFR